MSFFCGMQSLRKQVSRSISENLRAKCGTLSWLQVASHEPTKCSALGSSVRAALPGLILTEFTCNALCMHVCAVETLANSAQDNAALIRERDALMQERDELMDQVKQLKAGDLITEELSDKHNNRVIYETPTDKQQGFEELKRQLNMRNAEILNIKVQFRFP